MIASQGAGGQAAVAYNDDVVRKFTVAAVFGGVAAFIAGFYIAMRLAFPVLNLGLEWTTFGRLRPLHTSAAIFAFGGSVLFATSFYSVQRTCRAPLFGRPASPISFSGANEIVLAATGYCWHHPGQGIRRAGWYVDLLTVVWVA